jgi:recombination associated protein RdgC
MDLLDAIEEKRFLGQEFLIWLWCASEERGGSVSLPGRGDVPVVFEKHMLLECGEGAECEKLVCRGQMTELKERLQEAESHVPGAVNERPPHY